MAGPMPPGPPAGPPPGAPTPPNQPPPAPTPGADEDPQGQSPAMKAVSMANDGLMQLSTIFEKAKGEVSPEEQKQLAGIVDQFHLLIESLSGGKEQQPAPKPAGGPMPAMAGRGSIPADQG